MIYSTIFLWIFRCELFSPCQFRIHTAPRTQCRSRMLATLLILYFHMNFNLILCIFFYVQWSWCFGWASFHLVRIYRNYRNKIKWKYTNLRFNIFINQYRIYFSSSFIINYVNKYSAICFVGFYWKYFTYAITLYNFTIIW